MARHWLYVVYCAVLLLGAATRGEDMHDSVTASKTEPSGGDITNPQDNKPEPDTPQEHSEDRVPPEDTDSENGVSPGDRDSEDAVLPEDTDSEGKEQEEGERSDSEQLAMGVGDEAAEESSDTSEQHVESGEAITGHHTDNNNDAGDEEIPLEVEEEEQQEVKGGHCIRTTEDAEGNVICEEYETEPGRKYKASREGGVSAFGIIMAIATCGVIFFAIGFFYNRFRGGDTKRQEQASEPLRMKQVYKPAPTDPPADEVDYKPPAKKIPTPEIIYTNHDEPDVRAQPDVVLPPPPSVKKQEVRKPMPPIGKYQSPIDIDPEEAELSDELSQSRLVFKYVPENTKSLTNNGTSVKVMVDCRGSDLHGGPLGEKRYCLDHFRFRWGADDTRGSEHSVAGKRYSGEIQLVHWNKEDFRSYAEASRYESGLSIISVFMEASEEQNTDLQVLLDVFKSIKYKGDSVEVPHHYFDPATLLPGNTIEYWTYPGSLTESPYQETVTWLIMKEPIKVSSAQMAAFRGLMRCERDESHGTSGEHLVDNFREQSACGDRHLRASFRSTTTSD